MFFTFYQNPTRKVRRMNKSLRAVVVHFVVVCGLKDVRYICRGTNGRASRQNLSPILRRRRCSIKLRELAQWKLSVSLGFGYLFYFLCGRLFSKYSTKKRKLGRFVGRGAIVIYCSYCSALGGVEDSLPVFGESVMRRRVGTVGRL